MAVTSDAPSGKIIEKNASACFCIEEQFPDPSGIHKYFFDPPASLQKVCEKKPGGVARRRSRRETNTSRSARSSFLQAEQLQAACPFYTPEATHTAAAGKRSKNGCRQHKGLHKKCSLIKGQLFTNPFQNRKVRRGGPVVPRTRCRDVIGIVT